MIGLGLAELKPSSLGLDIDKSPSSSVEERKKLRARERIREGRIVRLCDRKRWKFGRKIDLNKR